jgi:hypothetical protein
MNTAIVSALPLSVPNEISYEIAAVTPKLAQQWLGLNTSNRKLKPAQVASFAEDMRAGRWVLNGEAIKFAGPAYAPTKLLDGQNRLHAVLKAGVPVSLAVVFGVDPTAQTTMDSGSKRTAADNLSIAGIQNSNVVAAAAAIALRARAGSLTSSSKSRPSNATIAEFIGENPDIIKSGVIGAKFGNKADVSATLVTYTHWVFSKISPEDAYTFWCDAAEKTGLASGDPILALTNRFAESRRSRERVSTPVALSAIFRAWNYRRDGKPLQRVMFTARGQNIEIPALR